MQTGCGWVWSIWWGVAFRHRYKRTVLRRPWFPFLEDAKERARDSGRSLAGTEHLLLAIIHAPCCSAVTILKKLGVSLNQLCTLCSCDTAYGVRMERHRVDTLSRKNCPALFQYGKLMTDPASPCRYDPLVGREKEIQQMIRILSRRTKNNPLPDRGARGW